MKFNKKVSSLTSMSNKIVFRKAFVVQESSFELLHFDFMWESTLNKKANRFSVVELKANIHLFTQSSFIRLVIGTKAKSIKFIFSSLSASASSSSFASFHWGGGESYVLAYKHITAICKWWKFRQVRSKLNVMKYAHCSQFTIRPILNMAARLNLVVIPTTKNVFHSYDAKSFLFQFRSWNTFWFEVREGFKNIPFHLIRDEASSLFFIKRVVYEDSEEHEKCFTGRFISNISCTFSPP